MGELREKDGKLDTQGLLEENFFNEFSKEGGNTHITKKAINTNSSTGMVQPNPIVGNTEELLINAYEVRDELIDSFKQIKVGTALFKSMQTSIKKVGEIINGLGGEIEEFDPLSHMSGLNSPDTNKYASRVIENTVESYTLGSVKDAHLEESSIVVTFEGSLGTTQYTAIGTITPNSRWKGTEAIDYIYTPGEGKMSVKTADENGRWVDSSDGYNISWELLEGEPEDVQKNIEKIAQTKEEGINLNQNKLSNDIGDDFPIEEK